MSEGEYFGLPGEPHGIRTTRDYKVAERFTHNHEEYGLGGIFVFDTNKLRNRYKIIQYNDRINGHASYDEAEEVIATEVIENIDQYIIRIDLERKRISEGIIALEEDESFDIIDQMDKILSYSKLNIKD